MRVRELLSSYHSKFVWQTEAFLKHLSKHIHKYRAYYRTVNCIHTYIQYMHTRPIFFGDNDCLPNLESLDSLMPISLIPTAVVPWICFRLVNTYIHTYKYYINTLRTYSEAESPEALLTDEYLRDKIRRLSSTSTSTSRNRHRHDSEVTCLLTYSAYCTYFTYIYFYVHTYIHTYIPILP